MGDVLGAWLCAAGLVPAGRVRQLLRSVSLWLSWEGACNADPLHPQVAAGRL